MMLPMQAGPVERGRSRWGAKFLVGDGGVHALDADTDGDDAADADGDDGSDHMGEGESAETY